MKYLLIIFCIGTTILSCRPEEDIIAHDAVSLRFEQDTVSFDTLFTTEQSITKRLRVYNPSRKTVLIDYIGLSKGSESPYSLYVNGIRAKEFGEQHLIAGDSLLLLLEARLPATTDTLPYLANDLLLFNNRGLQQQVPVIGYGQNARFFSDSLLVCDQLWDSPVPYVFTRSVLVDTLCTLTIAKGTRLYFKPGASLYVKGSLIAEGDTAQTDRILFRSHRIGEGYDNQPGQWGGIIFMPGTKNNLLNYCTVRNANIGIYLEAPDEDSQPDLELGNCQIENNLWGGIVSLNSDLRVWNTLVHSSARYTVANMGGGHYSYEHCTLVNFFSQREPVPVLYISDYLKAGEDGKKEAEHLQFRMVNSIVWGNMFSAKEIQLESENLENVQLEVSHNLLRTTESFWQGNESITGKEVHLPKFKASVKYDYSLDSLSPAVNAGLPLEYKYDIRGKLRDQNPDIGAYEYIPTPASEEGQE